ncbi:MAG TPA: PEP-CTERM sorting domain-containing protein [Candidatus Sulfotelmatobacter sp.]|jgi:hypothetical protein
MPTKTRASTRVVQRFLAATVLALLFVPIMAHASSDTIVTFNGGGAAGTSASGVTGPFTLTNSGVLSIGIFTQAPGSTMSFSTGSLISGDLYGSYAGGGQIASWNPGGPNSFTINGSWNGYTGTIFMGQFSGAVSWIDNGCTGSGAKTVCHYDLTGAITGTWANGTKVVGETTQLLFTFKGAPVCSGCGNYNGGNIQDMGGTTAVTTPEPNSLGFMGAGLLGLGFVVRRKVRL